MGVFTFAWSGSRWYCSAVGGGGRGVWSRDNMCTWSSASVNHQFDCLACVTLLCCSAGSGEGHNGGSI